MKRNIDFLETNVPYMAEGQIAKPPPICRARIDVFCSGDKARENKKSILSLICQSPLRRYRTGRQTYNGEGIQ